MNIILLTHERELLKKTGTGKIVKDKLDSSTEILIWKRKEPSKLIEFDLDPKNTLLVYPGGDMEGSIDLTNIENFIIIDGTWQEANKIYNRSPYLKKYNRFTFSNIHKSTYNLRRNQKSSGLCTIESVIQLYRLKGDLCCATKLDSAYETFKKQYK